MNGAVLDPKTGSSISWIPKEYLPGDVENVEEAAKVLQYYGLDETSVWSFHRWSYPWKADPPKGIQSLQLKLDGGLVEIQGIQFENPSGGDVISFVHPISGMEHQLTVLEYEPKAKGEAQDGVSSIAIIGGADGPTALAFSKEGTIRPHMALSALHFKPVEHVTWKIVFREKLVEDFQVDLLR